MHSTACPDWRERIVAGESLIPPPIFEDEAADALDVFKSLKMVDAPKVCDAETGEWRHQTFGEVCEDWVFDFVSAIFGAYDRDNGTQLISEFFLLISKKNGKSTIAAGIMVTALVRNWRDAQELLLLAPTLEVANNAFVPAREMVNADPALMDLLHVQDHLKTITHRITRAVLKVVAADSGTVSGKKAGFVLVDEVWEFGKRHDADAMLREATGGLVARPEGFIIWLSTQSDRAPAGVFKTKLQYFRDVRDGEIVDPRSLPVLYEFPEDMIDDKSFLEPENFHITNPNLGRSVSAAWLEAELVKVLNAEGSELQVFLAKHLNVEIGMRLSHDRWRGADYWEACGVANLSIDELLERSEVVTIGIDGGGLDDLIGVCAIGRERETRRWLACGLAIANPIVLERRKDIATELLECIDEGSLLIRDVGEDMQALADFVAKILASGLLPEKNAVGFDPNNIAAIIEALISVGVTDAMLKRLIQGPALAPAINMLPRKLSDGSFLHDGSRLMTWCVGNAKVERRGNAVMLTKQLAGSAKIDPVIALLCAGILMSWNPAAAAGGSFWEAA